MRTHLFSLVVGLALVGCSQAPMPSPAVATQPVAEAHNAHAGHTDASSTAATTCDFGTGTCALAASNDRMHANMAVEWTGDTDVDFLRAMIPHHQGAVDMAQAVLTHGKNPEVKALAQEILDAQVREIAQMEAMIEALHRQEGGGLVVPTQADPHAHH